MLRRVQQTIRERDLIRPGMHVVAGVSGGADSTAMLYALWFLSQKMSFRLSAVHLHHGARGADADADAAAVEQLCFRLNIPLVLHREDVARTRQKAGVSFEMAARQARQELFLSCLRENKESVIALAHTRNDQAETVFMRLLTGAGLHGLSGMAYRNEPVAGLNIVRPMLDVSRAAIESFLRSHGLSWRDDHTNRDEHFVRNRIRHDLLPYIESKGFPHLSRSLVRLSEMVREESAFLEAHTERLVRDCRSGKKNESLDIKKVNALMVADQRRVVRRWLLEFRFGDRAVEFNLVERVLRLMHGEDKKPVFINSLFCVEKVRGQLCGRGIESSVQSLRPAGLKVPGRTELPDAGLAVTVSRSHGYQKVKTAIGKYPATAYIRRDQERLDLVVRSRRPGDVMLPTGMLGRVYLKELFINEKIPVGQRGCIPVLAAGDEVVWVAGYRISGTWAVPESGAPSWKIVIEQKQA